MDHHMLDFFLANIYAQLGAAVVIGIVAVSLSWYLIAQRNKKNKLQSYLNPDFTIAFLPRDSEHQ